ncbi:helix-turn-helix domain-containing protein [Pseudactinotalea sp. HY160]|nr:helix-turn-helix domain-containing protein [Pseudactinotalea sp. HY160]
MPTIMRINAHTGSCGSAPDRLAETPLGGKLGGIFDALSGPQRTALENPAHMTCMDQNQPTPQRIQHILTELGEAITDLTAREEEPVRINPRLLTVEEAGTYMGISRSSVYKLINDDALPTVEIVGKTRIDREQLDDWISARRRRVS